MLLNLQPPFTFKSVTPFQSNFKTPKKKHNKTLHQQSLSLNDTDITSDDEEHIYSRFPKPDSTFLNAKTLHEENFSTITKQKPITKPESNSAMDVKTHSQPSTHCSQIIPFYVTSFFKKN